MIDGVGFLIQKGEEEKGEPTRESGSANISFLEKGK